MRPQLLADMPIHIDPLNGVHFPWAIVLWLVCAGVLAAISFGFWAARYNGHDDRSYHLRLAGFVVSAVLALAALLAAIAAIPRVVFVVLAVSALLIVSASLAPRR